MSFQLTLQGSLQQRLQQAATRLVGSRAAHATSGNLGPPLQKAAADSVAAHGSPDEAQHDQQQQWVHEGDVAAVRIEQEQQQRCSITLPLRPSRTPVPRSAQRAPALDRQSVSALLHAHANDPLELF